MYGEPPGPSTIIHTETEEEKKAARDELEQENAGWRAWDMLEFVAQEQRKEEDA
jgi:hypothetical protein